MYRTKVGLRVDGKSPTHERNEICVYVVHEDASWIVPSRVWEEHEAYLRSLYEKPLNSYHIADRISPLFFNV